MRAAPLALRDGDRERLESWLRSSTIQAGLAQRARIVLLAAVHLDAHELRARIDDGTATPEEREAWEEVDTVDFLLAAAE